MEERYLADANLEQFRRYLCTEEKSPITIEKYMRDAKRFASFVARKSVIKELVVAYKQTLIEQGYALRSINSMIISVNCLLRFLEWNDCVVKTLRLQRQIYTPEEKELSKGEYLRLIDASREQPQLNHIIQTICGTGIRISELKYFTVESIRRGEVIVNCKNKTRIIIIPGKLRKRLLDYAKKHNIKNGMIFVTRFGNPVDRSNIWAKMKRLCKAAHVNPSKVFPHNLRKLFARTFYKVEKDIAKLADILGHSSIETTRIYIMTSGHEHRQKIDRLGLVV